MNTLSTASAPTEYLADPSARVITSTHPAESHSRRTGEAINRHPWLVWIALSVLYFAITFALASIKIVWLDEFITLYISKLGSLRSIWNALGHGADPNPPLTYLLVLLSRKLLGSSAVAMRVPDILASWAGMLAIYAFLKRRVPPLYAAAGVLFFMCTAAFDYSFECRSYAIMFGFACISLLAWRTAIEGKHKTLGTVGLAAALAAGISSNYFGVLAFFPIAAGELFRDIRQRRIEWKVWAALALAGSTLLIYLPLINKAVATFSPYAWNKVQLDVIADSYQEMVEIILWPALGLLALGALMWFRRKGTTNERSTVLPAHEAVAAFVFMLYPFIAYGIARIRGGMLSPRFVIPMCCGFAIAVSVMSYQLLRRWAWPGLALVALLVAWVFAREAVVARMYYDQRLALFRIIDSIPIAPAIAVPDSLLVLPLYHYAPPEIASRIFFPVDFPEIRKYKREDSPEQNLWNGRHGIYPVPILTLDQFTAEHPSYLIAAPTDNWMVQTLTAGDTPPRILPIYTDTQDITGFTPLSHRPVWFYAEGSLGKFTAIDARTISPHSRSLETHETGK